MIALETFDNFIDFPHKSNEWYTPSRYIEAARQVMGSIDLDPASCEMANRTVKADRYYTKEENGLSKPWYGRVWLNPPYGRVNGSGASVIRMFVTKLINEYQSGNIEQAILLTTEQSNATWFQYFWNYLICFADHRVHFYRTTSKGVPEKESRTGHMLGSVFVYLGPKEQKFIDVFSQFGTIAKRVSQPKPAVTPLQLWEGH